MENETKKCPYCAETIAAEAKKCKHCGEFLDASLKPKIEAPKQEPQQVVVQSKNSGLVTFLVVLAIIALLVWLIGA